MPNFRASRELSRVNAPRCNRTMRGHAIGPAAQQALSLTRLAEIKRMRMLCQRLGLGMSLVQFRAMEAARLKARIAEDNKQRATAAQAARVTELEAA